MEKLPISYDQMRSLVLEALPSSNQIVDLYVEVGGVAVKHGLISSPVGTGFGQGQVRLNPQDKSRIRSIVWNLIVEGIIRPGSGDANEWPFIEITEYGREVLKDHHPTPYDPDSYLGRVKREVPAIDAVILNYLTESLRTFRINCLLSSVVMLGCASEKTLLVLIDAYTGALSEPSRSKFQNNTEGRMIKRQFDEFRKMLESHLKSKLPGDLKDGLDVELNAIFDIIRNDRNDAGHPTGKIPERERVV
jgi:hypothetical protein